MSTNLGYISTVQDFLDLAKNLEGIDPTEKIIFCDSDYNHYQISGIFVTTCIGDALGLGEEDMKENDEDYFEKCLSFNVE